MPRGRPFAKGNKASAGVKKPNSGRDPDWLKAKCHEIIDRLQLVEFLGKVAGGENVEQVVTDQGEALPVPASVKDRLRAVEMLLDRGYGKVSQPLSNPDGSPISITVVKYGD